MIDYIIVCEIRQGAEDKMYFEAWAEDGGGRDFSENFENFAEHLIEVTHSTSIDAKTASKLAEEKLAAWIAHEKSEWKARPIILEAEINPLTDLT